MGALFAVKSTIKSAPIRLYVPLLRHALRAGFAVRSGIGQLLLRCLNSGIHAFAMPPQ